MTTRACIAVLSLIVLASCDRAGRAPAGDLSPIPATQYITDAFDRHPLVGFSEPRHGAGGTKEFLATLIRQPGFAGSVNDIVVEFGNSRYQALVDRYVSGEAVPREELKQAWENTTIATGEWLAPMYEEVLSDIRTANDALPPPQRFRVLLGDPPIDWTVVRGPADEDMNDWRDAHFAWVVEEQVMKRGRKALIWIGGAHLSRKVKFPNSLIHLLDRRFPGATLVVNGIDRRDVPPHVSDRLRAWPSLTAATTRRTWLGALPAEAIGFRFSTGSIEENIDAAMFWPLSAGVDETPRLDPGSSIAAELQRRRRLSEATLPFRGGQIRFAANAPDLMPDSSEPLGTVLAELGRDAGLTLVVKAFTDAREPDAARLSRQRAQVVVDWLTARGISPERLTPIGCEASRALWSGETEQERAANRRAELVRRSEWATCEPPSSFTFR